MTFAVATGTLRLAPEGHDGRPREVELGFPTEALILWWASASDPRRTLVNAGGIGLWAPARAAAAAWSADFRAPGTFGRWQGDCPFLAASDPTGGPELVGTVSRTDSGFSLDARGTTSSPWAVHYAAFGGAGVEGAAVGRLDLDETGFHPVSRLGFRPSFLFFLVGASRSPSSIGSAAGFAVDPDQQTACGFEATAAGGTTVTRSAFRADAVVAVPRTDDSWEYSALASLASIEEEGFTLSCYSAPTDATPVSFLAVGGGHHAVTLARQPRRRRRRTTLDVPVAPAAMLTLTSGLDTMARIRDLGRLCLGAVSRGSSGCITWSIRRHAWPPEPRSRASSESAVEVMDTTSGRLYARAVSLDLGPPGVTLGWPKRDRNPRHVACALLGQASLTEQSRRRRARDYLWRLRRE